MTKSSAFGTVLNMGAGNVQVETATIVGTITNPGDINVVVTAAGLSGGADTLVVTVANGNASSVAETVRTFIRNDATAAGVRSLFEVSGATDKVILTRKIPMLHDGTLNIATDTGTATGLTTTASSANTHVGETLAPVAYISNIGGPSLALDTEDVTTHDSTGAWEEVVGTILRTGELSLDIVYDPNEATHNASTGLIAMSEARLPVGLEVVFPNTTAWAFAAYITGFEPSAPHDGALTATVKAKITGAPILA